MVSSCLDRDERASYLGWKRRSGRGQMAQLGGTLAGGGGLWATPITLDLQSFLRRALGYLEPATTFLRTGAHLCLLLSMSNESWRNCFRNLQSSHLCSKDPSVELWAIKRAKLDAAVTHTPSYLQRSSEQAH